NWAPQDQKLADVLDRRRIQLVREFGEDGFPGLSFVGKDAELDHSMSLESGIGFLDDGRREAVAADQHDRVEVMGEGALFLALGRSQLNGWHALIIVCQ